MEKAGQRNAYVCQECGKSIVTENLDDGTTPFMIACRATKGCRGAMYSTFYSIPQSTPATYEWFKPQSMKGYSREMQEHFRMGGLDLRERRPTQRAADGVETCADCRLQYTSSCPSLRGERCQYFQPRR